MDTLIEITKRPSKGPDGPNVQDLIDALMKIENKTLPIFGYIGDFEGMSIDIIKIDSLDLDITDRVDINMQLSD